MKGFKAEKVCDRYDKGTNLSQDGGDCRALHAHMKYEDENGVKNRIDDSAENHGKHSILRASIRTDHGIECGGNHHKQADPCQ